jgi:flagellar biosynthetic protein FliO
VNGISGLELISSGTKTIAMWLLVLGLLIFVLYALKRGLFSRSRSKEQLLIHVLSSFNLSPKERIEVIEISGERLVLGVTPGNINLLTKLKTLKSEKGEAESVLKDDLLHGTNT